MEQDEWDQQIEVLRRFFSYDSFKEWAKAVGHKEEEAPDAYRTEQARLEGQIGPLVAALVAADRSDRVAELVRNAKQELIVPVCKTLSELAYAPAVLPLTKQYRGNSPEVQVSILQVIAATGSMEGYLVALEGQAHKHPAIREAAGAAMKAISAKHPTLAAIAALADGQMLAVAHLEPREVARLLAVRLPLSQGIRALRTLRKKSAVLARHVQTHLLRLDGDDQRAMLLLASQDWSLPAQDERAVAQAFHRAGPGDRRLLLKALPDAAAARLLASGLEPSGKKNLEQVLAHLESDLPHLVPALGEPLLACATGATPLLGARALILLGRYLSEEEQSHHDVPRRLWSALSNPGMKPLRRALLAALLSSAVGRALFSKERLSAESFNEVTELLSQPHGELDLTNVFFAVASGLSGEHVLDFVRLGWLLQHIGRVPTETQDGCLPALARAITAQLSYGEDAVVEPLLQELGARSQLWNALAPGVLVRLAGLPAERLQRVLHWLVECSADPLGHVTAGLAAVETNLRLFLDGLAGCEAKAPGQGAAWLAGHDRDGLYAQLLASTTMEMAEAIHQASDRFQREDLEARTQLEETTPRLLEVLAAVVPSVAERDRPAAEQLASYLQDLEEAVYAVVDTPAMGLPIPPIAAGEPLYDYLQAQVVDRTVATRLKDRSSHFAADLGNRIALPIEKLQLLMRGMPEEGALLSPLAGWIESQGLARVEPELGRLALYQPIRHERTHPELVQDRFPVRTWGLAAADGSILRPAIVGPEPEREEVGDHDA